MTWILTIVILLFLLVAWLLLAPISMEIDTALLRARLSWTGIGGASLWYDGQWWVFYTVPFYHKKINLSGTKDAGKAKDANEKDAGKAKDAGEKKDAGERSKKKKRLPPFSKIIRCIKTFEVKEWRLAIDTGDYALNGQLYPLNFMPQLHEHLEINFIDKNFLFMKIRGIPWKMLYAFIRK